MKEPVVRDWAGELQLRLKQIAMDDRDLDMLIASLDERLKWIELLLERRRLEVDRVVQSVLDAAVAAYSVRSDS